MDTPPTIDDFFEDETIVERVLALSEMFPEKLRDAVSTTVSKSASSIKWVFSASRAVTWFICSTAAILVLPISLETERQEYKEQMRRQERNIILGPETGQGAPM